MKIFTVFVMCFVLSSGLAFAQNLPDEAQKNNQDTNTADKSGYKSSPRLNYHSNNPADEDNVLGNLKPMLNQMTGNSQNGSTGGAEIPGSAKFSF